MIRVLCEDAAMIGTQLYTLHVTSLLFVFLLVLTYNISKSYLYSRQITFICLLCVCYIVHIYNSTRPVSIYNITAHTVHDCIHRPKYYASEFFSCFFAA